MGPQREELEFASKEVAAEAPKTETKTADLKDATAVSADANQQCAQKAGKMPVECFITCDVPFNWFFRPEMLFGPILYNVSINACAWIYDVCPLSAETGAGYVFVIAFGKVGMIGLALDAPRWVVVVFGLFDAVGGVLSNKLFDTSLMGTLGSVSLQVICSIVACCLGKLEARRCRYFLASSFWLLVTQICPVMVLRFNWLLEILPGFLEAMALPIISVCYSAVAVRSLRLMNRALISPGMPVRPLTGIMYPVLAIAQCLVMAGFIPRAEELESQDATLLLRRFGGAVVSTVGSELLSRFFAFQRTKHFLETKLGLTPKPLKIEPEMDSYMRSCFALDHVTVFWAVLLMVLAMPGGAFWAFEPLVWFGIALRWLAAMFCDFVIIAVNRNLHPIPKESFYQTTMRLQQCFQHWPELQCDEGRNFEAAKAASERGESSTSLPLKLSPEASELAEAKWSNHSYLNDARAIAFITAWCPMMLLVAGFIAIYGECGLWKNYALPMCQ